MRRVCRISPNCSDRIYRSPLSRIRILRGDRDQKRHSVLRNYPVLGHVRFMLEPIRSELQQYFIERNDDGRPYDRDVRSLVYQRAKGLEAEQAFGTERNVYAEGYEYFESSMRPRPMPAEQPRARTQ